MKAPSWPMIGRLAIVVAVAGLVVGSNNWRERYSFGLNVTESLPHWAFVVELGVMPERGDLAAFIAPDNPLYEGVFVKRVVGLEGDLIEVDGQEVTVNGSWSGHARERNDQGTALTRIEPQTIPAGHVFFATDDPLSFDSRYAEIGLIERGVIVGRVKPIL